MRASVHNPGYHVLSARVEEQVSHVMIRNTDGAFDVGGGPSFPSLNELVEHYKKNPMVETSGMVIHLKHPFHATGFLPAKINSRVQELQKQNQEVYGKAGFWEEFEVRAKFGKLCVLKCVLFFQFLQQMECKHLYSRREGAKPENKVKNRYKNILPCEFFADSVL